MSDLKYKTSGIFTIFYPFTDAGETAWNDLAAQNEGACTIFTAHLKSTLQQLRAAGYTVKKTTKIYDNLDDIDWAFFGI